MRPFCVTAAALLAAGILLVAAACGGQPASQVPTAAPSVASPTSAPASTSAATAAPAAQPTAAPAPTKPAASPTAAAVSFSDLMSKARQATEYSYDMRASGAETFTGKVFIKGTKMRQELAGQGQQMIMITDSAAKTAYALMPAQRQAIKMDYAMAFVQAPRYDSTLSQDARYVGTETVDGKSAAVYEQTAGFVGKYWIWIERGLPLKVETPAGSSKQVIEFLNYQFGPQADTLFEIPAGYETIQAPAGFGSGVMPAPTAPAQGTMPTLPAGALTPAVPRAATPAASVPTPAVPQAAQPSANPALPEELRDIPIPEGFTMNPSSARRVVTNGVFQGAQATWVGRGEPAAIGTFYKRLLVTKGWTEGTIIDGTDDVDLTYTQVRSDGEYELHIAITRQDDGTNLQIDVVK